MGVASVVAVAIALLSWYTGRRHAAAMEAMAESQMRIAKSLERDLKRLKKESSARQDPNASLLRAQELEERRRRAEWQKTKDIAKGIKWAVENIE